MTNNQDHEEDKVYFCFQEDPVTDNIKALGGSTNAFIFKSHLKVKKDSFLSQMADNNWGNTSVGCVGSESGNPIVVSITPCTEEWSPSLVTMIQASYQHFHKKEKNAPTLPKHVELWDALIVLQYFGLQVHDPADIPLDKATEGTRIRAKLLIKQLPHVSKAKEYVFKQLGSNPGHETHFLFTEKPHQVELANHRNFPTATDLNIVKFTAMGNSEEECENNYDWVSYPLLRKHFVSLLQDEVDLEAQFLTGTEEEAQNGFPLVNLDPEAFFRTPSVMCILRGRARMCVLRVRVPPL